MDLGSAKLGAIVSVELVAEYLRGLQRIGTIPAEFASTSNGADFVVALAPLDFELAKPAQSAAFARLHITGQVSAAGGGVALPLDTWVRFTPILRPGSNQPLNAPVLGFRYDGVDVPPVLPLTAALIDQVFNSGPVATILGNVSIDVLDPLIQAAGAAFFSDPAVPPPSAGLWSTDITLMPSTAQGTSDALGMFVDLPGGNATPAETMSFLPDLTEFGIVYGREFLNVQLAAINTVGQTIDGAEITAFEMHMGNDAILIEGSATKDVAEIDFTGPITSQLIRGSSQFLVDASAIDVTVDLPWWADVFFFLAGPGGFLTLGLTPIFGGMIFEAVKGKSVSDALAEVDAAPGAVQSSVSGTFGIALSGLAQALSNLGALGALQPAYTPESSLTESGNIAIFAQVFVNPTSQNISNGTYSRRANQLLELQLDSGRWLVTSELARIFAAGLIDTPGYHAVAPHMRGGLAVRGYMQDNPDLDKSDNLLTRFGG